MTLALGIGANMALFSIADPLLTRPLAVTEPEQLVLFRTVGSPAWSDVQGLVPYTLFERLRYGSSAFADSFVVEHQREARRMRTVDVDGSTRGAPVAVMPVSGSYFKTLGVIPTLGRMFVATDDRTGAEPVAVISYGFWQRRYGANPSAIGTVLSLENSTLNSASVLRATIVGVAPQTFYGTELDFSPDAWLAITAVREASGTLYRYGTNVGIVRMMARLRPGVSLQQAQAEIDDVTPDVLESLRDRGIYARVPASKARIRVEPAPHGYSMIRDQFRKPLIILIGAVTVLLLLACGNVATLIFARAASRYRDLAIRLAIGSGRATIVRLLLTESVILCAVGGGLVLLAFRWVRLFVIGYVPQESALAAMIRFDGRLLAFTTVVSLTSVVLCGVAPAVWISRLDLNRLVRESSGTSRHHGIVDALHKMLIPAQVAFSLLLLINAGVFLTTLQNLRSVETGFDEQRVIQFSIDARTALRSSASAEPNVLPSGLLERLAAFPEVESLTFYNHGGLLQETEQPTVKMIRNDAQSRYASDVLSMTVGPRFFETTDISIVAGQSFGPTTTSSDAILSASLARHLFGTQERAIGRSVLLPGLTSGPDVSLHVVGVAEDAPHLSLRDPHVWTIYYGRPATAGALAISLIAIRTRTDRPALLAPAIREAVRTFNAGFEATDVQTLEVVKEASIASDRLLAQLSAVFGLLALLLASTGVYALVSYIVTHRTAEIALRMALGARFADIIHTVVFGILLLVVAGAALGLLLVGVSAPTISTLLFGVEPYDVSVIVVAILTLVTAAAVAAYLPVRRIVYRVAPADVLR